MFKRLCCWQRVFRAPSASTLKRDYCFAQPIKTSRRYPSLFQQFEQIAYVNCILFETTRIATLNRSLIPHVLKLFGSLNSQSFNKLPADRIREIRGPQHEITQPVVCDREQILLVPIEKADQSSVIPMVPGSVPRVFNFIRVSINDGKHWNPEALGDYRGTNHLAFAVDCDNMAASASVFLPSLGQYQPGMNVGYVLKAFD